MAVNDYCTISEVKDAMPDSDWGSSYDAVLATLATRASRLIDGILVRQPGAFYVSSDSTLYFDGNNSDKLWIKEMAAEPTSLHVLEDGLSYTQWQTTDYMMYPYNAIAMGEPYLRVDIKQYPSTKVSFPSYQKAVKIVGKFGFSVTIPDEIKEAAVIQVSRWFKRGQQAFIDTGAIIELGQLRYTNKLDPDVITIIEIPKFRYWV